MDNGNDYTRLAHDRLEAYKINRRIIARYRAQLMQETDGRKLRKIRRQYAEQINVAKSLWDGFKMYAKWACEVEANPELTQSV